jgi:hypothetical protein
MLLPAVVAGGIVVGLSAVAQDGSSPPAKAAKATKAAKAASAKAAVADRSLREQEIYIPYEKLRQVFEKHGRGVFLPYEKFDELWRAAQDRTRPAAKPRPPVGAVITETENEATVSKDVVQVSAQVKIDLLTEGWHEVPLRLADSALVRATLGDQPARILGGAGEDHRLLVEKKGEQPEEIVLRLEYARAITRSPGQNSVSFQAPQAPVSRWRVRIPQAGVKVNISPLIAATEVPAGKAAAEKPAAAKPAVAKPASEKPAAEKAPAEKPAPEKPAAAKADDETVILAFVGASPTVRIDWTPKAEGATGLAPLASVQADQQVWIQEGVTRARTNLAYTISRAELSQLAIEVPADYKVVNVFDPNVRQWSIAAAAPAAVAGAAQRIDVQLFEPAKAAQQITVELEKIAGQKRQDTLKAPVVRALGVGRQQGFVAVQVGSGLRAEATRTAGLLQVDAAELPPPLRAAGWAFSYRYATVPFELELSIEEVLPRITVDSLVEARLEPERLTLDLTAIYTIERAGVFKLELDVPPGFDVRQVRGRSIPAGSGQGPGGPGTAAAEVDSHHLEGEKKNRLVVNLARKATGRVALAVQLQKDLQEPNLLAPGKTAEIPLPVPQIVPSTVERATGRLRIHAPESLRLTPGKAEGLRSVSFKEALEGMPWADEAKPQAAASSDARTRAELRPVLAYTFTQEPVVLRPVVLRLTVERRRPQVTIRQLLVGRIEEGVIKYQATFFYSILYSGVKSLRIDVPADVVATLHNTTPGVREKTLDPPQPDLANEMVAWSLTGDAELHGEGKIELVWEKKIDKLEVGRSVDLAVPRLVPREVDRAWGQIVLAKAETLDVQEAGQPQGLRPIDPQRDLMAEVPGGARAFEFHDDWSLAVTVTRYELEEVKRTSIDRAVVRMVITPAGELAVQALYRIRSARQRLTMGLPERAQFDTEPLRINGQPVALERGGEGQFVVPLAAASADQSQLLELRYTVQQGARRLSLPVFTDDTALQKVRLCVFVPAAQALLGTSGPWSEEFQWLCRDGRWVAHNKDDDKALVNWVAEGVKGAGSAADSFHTDGTLYVFSTLRPAADATLTVRTIDRTALGGLIFALVVLGGLALTPSRFAGRAMAIGGLVVALVLAAVFCPTFSLQVLNGTLAAAIFIVLVFWAVVAVFRLRPAMALACQAMKACCASRAAAKAPPPPPAAPPPAAAQPAEAQPTEAGPAEGGPSHG